MASNTTQVDINLVQLEYEKRLAWVTYNRPGKRNTHIPACGEDSPHCSREDNHRIIRYPFSLVEICSDRWSFAEN